MSSTTSSQGLPQIPSLPSSSQPPNSSSTTATHAFIHSHVDTPTYNHVMRSTFFGAILSAKLASMGQLPANFDREIHACAAMMHDLAWNADWEGTKEFVSKDKRFEVDGAIAAVNFLNGLSKEHRTAGGEDPKQWDQRRKQLVWDAIALHATLSICWLKEPEVMLTSYGIMTDFAGPNAPVFPQGPDLIVTQEEYDAVVAKFPRLDLAGYVKNAFCGLCRAKPAATYDNLVGDFGEKFLEKEAGYDRTGKLAVDIVMSSRERLDGVQADAPYKAT